MDINTVNNKIMVIYHGFIFFIENNKKESKNEGNPLE